MNRDKKTIKTIRERAPLQPLISKAGAEAFSRNIFLKYSRGKTEKGTVLLEFLRRMFETEIQTRLQERHYHSAGKNTAFYKLMIRNLHHVAPMGSRDVKRNKTSYAHKFERGNTMIAEPVGIYSLFKKIYKKTNVVKDDRMVNSSTGLVERYSKSNSVSNEIRNFYNSMNRFFHFEENVSVPAEVKNFSQILKGDSVNNSLEAIYANNVMIQRVRLNEVLISNLNKQGLRTSLSGMEARGNSIPVETDFRNAIKVNREESDSIVSEAEQKFLESLTSTRREYETQSKYLLKNNQILKVQANTPLKTSVNKRKTSSDSNSGQAFTVSIPETREAGPVQKVSQGTEQATTQVSAAMSVKTPDERLARVLASVSPETAARMLGKAPSQTQAEMTAQLRAQKSDQSSAETRTEMSLKKQQDKLAQVLSSVSPETAARMLGTSKKATVPTDTTTPADATEPAAEQSLRRMSPKKAAKKSRPEVSPRAPADMQFAPVGNKDSAKPEQSKTAEKSGDTEPKKESVWSNSSKLSGQAQEENSPITEEMLREPLKKEVRRSLGDIADRVYAILDQKIKIELFRRGLK